MKRVILTLAFLASLAAVPVHAVVPSTMSHQGILTDNTGAIVPDGFYDITFRIFNVPVGGVVLWAEQHLATPVALGQYSLVLGDIIPIDLPFDEQYWLEVHVAPQLPITPRIELGSSPYALSLRLPFAQTISSGDPLMELTNPGTGPEIQLGSIINSGLFWHFINGGASRSLEITDHNGNGASVNLFDEDGANSTTSIQPDDDGAGGWFRVSGVDISASSFSTGLLVDGNHLGFMEPFVAIWGQPSMATFDMTQSGNSSVDLPADAINALETLDELGVAQEKVDGDFLITSSPSMEDVVVLTITIPAPGYITLVAAAQYRQGNTTLGNYASYQIDETAGGTTDSNHYFNAGYSSDPPSGFHYIPVQIQRTYFKNAAGAYTFRLEARRNTANGTRGMWNPTLTALFTPTAYGTVHEAVSPISAAMNADAQPVSVGDNGDGNSSSEAFSVDLRELEQRAAKLRTEADLARLELERARATNVAPAGGR